MSTARAYKSIVAASVVLAVCTAIAANQQISVFEGQILTAIYDVPGPFKELMYGVTQTGSLGAVLVVILMSLVLKRRKLARLLLANAAVTYVVTLLIKQFIARPRPAEIVPAIVVRLEHASGFGFPSGHTAIVTVLALTLMPYVAKNYRWLLWLWIAVVAVSRVYLGVHAPLDIVGGFCVGVIVAGIMQLIVDKRRSSS